MDLWLLEPYCDTCIQSNPFENSRLPDIEQSNWEVDILLNLGPKTLERVNSLLSDDSDFSFVCKKCRKPLRPWDNDEVYIVKNHFEEYYGIPLVQSNKIIPNKLLRRQIFKFYNNKCFNCGSTKRLHIDHILPRSEGGDVAFRNLQPLCEKCGNDKGNALPEEVEVYCDIYFGHYPSDAYEELFWSLD